MREDGHDVLVNVFCLFGVDQVGYGVAYEQDHDGQDGEFQAQLTSFEVPLSHEYENSESHTFHGSEVEHVYHDMIKDQRAHVCEIVMDHVCHAKVLYAYRVMHLHVYHGVVIVNVGTSHVFHVRVYNGHVFTLFDDGSHIHRNMIH